MRKTTYFTQSQLMFLAVANSQPKKIIVFLKERNCYSVISWRYNRYHNTIGTNFFFTDSSLSIEHPFLVTLPLNSRNSKLCSSVLLLNENVPILSQIFCLQ